MQTIVWNEGAVVDAETTTLAICPTEWDLFPNPEEESSLSIGGLA
jgi:hypothetical protein